MICGVIHMVTRKVCSFYPPLKLYRLTPDLGLKKELLVVAPNTTLMLLWFFLNTSQVYSTL